MVQIQKETWINQKKSKDSFEDSSRRPRGKSESKSPSKKPVKGTKDNKKVDPKSKSSSPKNTSRSSSQSIQSSQGGQGYCGGQGSGCDQEKWKKIAWSRVRDTYCDGKAKHKMEHYWNESKQQYGFFVDPSKMPWENIVDYYENMDICPYLVGGRMSMACHDLCSRNKVPEGIAFLLNLSENYCVQRTKLNPHKLDKTMERLRKNTR